jgi:hypothetical protein
MRCVVLASYAAPWAAAVVLYRGCLKDTRHEACSRLCVRVCVYVYRDIDGDHARSGHVERVCMDICL